MQHSVQLCARAALVVAGILAGASHGWADKLTEENMTQRDYNAITAQESSVEGEPRTVPPTPVHDLTAEDEAQIRAAGGVKLIPGKDWKKETPEERDAHLRRMDATLPVGSTYIISVPKGDVWLIPAPKYIEGSGLDQPFTNLQASNNIRLWTEEQRAALPTVRPEKKVSQSDKRGIGGDTRVAAAPREEP